MFSVSVKVYAFFILILGQALHIYGVDVKEDSFSGVAHYTKYISDEYDFIWRIANYSQIFEQSEVYTKFSIESSSTRWTLKLQYKTDFILYRDDAGEPVNVKVKYHLQARHGIYTKEKSIVFSNLVHDSVLLDMEKLEYGSSTAKIHKSDIEFENDVVNFICKMTIMGPVVTTHSMN